MMANDVVALIPARGGSKGVPGKNLAKVGGIPLVARAIIAAQAAKSIGSIYVSTDDNAIKEVANQFGAQVIHRPPALSGDAASSESALLHSLDELALNGIHPDTIVFLQPTSPFIPSQNLRDAIVKVQERQFDVLFSAVPFHGFIWQNQDGQATGVNHEKSVRLRRQDRNPEFLETGAFYVMNAAGFREAKHRFFGRVGVEIVPADASIEIDTPADLQLARSLSGPVSSESTPIPVKALVMDFDGVHTDNRAILDQDGREFVAVNRSDGMGIQLLKAAGIQMLILSKERVPLVLQRAEKLGIPAVCAIDDKEQYLRTWCDSNNLSLAEVAYVGNDVNDVTCMKIVGWPIAVADAHPVALTNARIVLDASGGNGAVREIADRILARSALAE